MWYNKFMKKFFIVFVLFSSVVCAQMTENHPMLNQFQQGQIIIRDSQMLNNRIPLKDIDKKYNSNNTPDVEFLHPVKRQEEIQTTELPNNTKDKTQSTAEN